MTNDSYGPMCAEFYDADKPRAELSEVDFFARHLDEAKGPSLEAMCGSGRLLIPLLERGYSPEGVDSSSAMLARLRERCRRKRLLLGTTYQDNIAEMKLPKKYAVIFIALGSIQLLTESEAIRALKNLRQHLLEGGRLLLDTFVPWELLSHPSGKLRSNRILPSGKTTIHLSSEILVDTCAQTYCVDNVYERRLKGQRSETEVEHFDVRWYLPQQLMSLLASLEYKTLVHPIPKLSERPRRYLFDCRI